MVSIVDVKFQLTRTFCSEGPAGADRERLAIANSTQEATGPRG
jgi:hypothetical protein